VIAELIIKIGTKSIEEKNSFSIAFPGGKTPTPVYNSLRKTLKTTNMDLSFF